MRWIGAGDAYSRDVGESEARLERGLAELGLDRIVAAAHSENAASQRVLEKVGFRFERMTTYDGALVRLYAVATL